MTVVQAPTIWRIRRRPLIPGVAKTAFFAPGSGAVRVLGENPQRRFCVSKSYDDQHNVAMDSGALADPEVGINSGSASVLVWRHGVGTELFIGHTGAIWVKPTTSSAVPMRSALWEELDQP